MAAQANLVLKNRSNVDKTFVPHVPYGGQNQPAVWILKEGVSPMAWPRVEIAMKRNANGTTSVVPKVIVPNVVDDPAKGPSLVSKCLFDSATRGFIIPQNAVTTQIEDLEAFTRSLFASAVLSAWVKTFEPSY